MKRLRHIKLLAGAFLLVLMGSAFHSCNPVVRTCYKPMPPEDIDSSSSVNVSPSPETTAQNLNSYENSAAAR